MTREAMSPAEFEQALRARGACYHIFHPYHVAMYEGRATREQIQGWVANRFYYQLNIPLKDAAILANCPDREVRREWLQRVLDHDGAPGEEGGIEAWLRLAEAVGLDRQQVFFGEAVLEEKIVADLFRARAERITAVAGEFQVFAVQGAVVGGPEAVGRRIDQPG